MPPIALSNRTQAVSRISVVSCEIGFFWLTVGLIAASAFVGCSKSAPSRAKPATPTVVLEATETLRGGMGDHQDARLLLRLTDDGKVQWDGPGGGYGRQHERKGTSISAERVTSIRGRLNSFDMSNILPEMGPYNRYVDTSLELHLRMATSAGEREFSVMNWACVWNGICGEPKKIPNNVLSMICEIYGLHSELAHEPTQEECKGEGKVQK
jgi:hypothetical protein